MTTPLQRVRQKRKLTQREVATKNEIDPGHYNRMEKGTEKITPANAEKLSLYFGGAVTELELLYPDRFSRRSDPNEAA